MSTKYNPNDDPLLSLQDGELDMETAEEIAAMLAFDADPAPPPAALKRRVMEQAAGQPQESAFLFVRKGEGIWNRTPFHGVSSKRLYTDPGTNMTTWLVKLEPGAKYPAHSHAEPEQCLVLEGDVRFGEAMFSAGDYMCSLRGSEHEVSTSEKGCLLLIINSPHDKIHI